MVPQKMTVEEQIQSVLRRLLCEADVNQALENKNRCRLSVTDSCQLCSDEHTESTKYVDAVSEPKFGHDLAQVGVGEKSIAFGAGMDSVDV
jgi:hypothetical protein